MLVTQPLSSAMRVVSSSGLGTVIVADAGSAVGCELGMVVSGHDMASANCPRFNGFSYVGAKNRLTSRLLCLSSEFRGCTQKCILENFATVAASHMNVLTVHSLQVG